MMWNTSSTASNATVKSRVLSVFSHIFNIDLVLKINFIKLVNNKFNVVQNLYII